MEYEHYIHNLHEDVVAIVDAAGNAVIEKWKEYAGTYCTTVALYERDTAMGTMSYVVRWTLSTNSVQESIDIFPMEGFVSDEYLQDLAVVSF